MAVPGIVRALLVEGLEAGPNDGRDLGLQRPGDLLTRGTYGTCTRTARPPNGAACYSAARLIWSGSMRSGPRSTAWRGRCRAPRAACYVAARRSRQPSAGRPRSADARGADGAGGGRRVCHGRRRRPAEGAHLRRIPAMKRGAPRSRRRGGRARGRAGRPRRHGRWQVARTAARSATPNARD